MRKNETVRVTVEDINAVAENIEAAVKSELLVKTVIGIGTTAYHLRELADRFGSQSVVASIDVKLDRLRRYRCVVAGGTRPTGETPLALAQRAQALGAGEVLLNSVDRDGMMQGYDLKLVRSVADGLTVPLIACGGARDAADLGRVLHEGHAHAAAAGSLFVYFGPLKAVLINVPSEEELCRLGVYQPR